MKATHEKDWLVLPASGEQVEFETAIFFPWDSKAKRLFTLTSIESSTRNMEWNLHT